MVACHCGNAGRTCVDVSLPLDRRPPQEQSMRIVTYEPSPLHGTMVGDRQFQGVCQTQAFRPRGTLDWLMVLTLSGRGYVGAEGRETVIGQAADRGKPQPRSRDVALAVHHPVHPSGRNVAADLYRKRKAGPGGTVVAGFSLEHRPGRRANRIFQRSLLFHPVPPSPWRPALAILRPAGGPVSRATNRVHAAAECPTAHRVVLPGNPHFFGVRMPVGRSRTKLL